MIVLKVVPETQVPLSQTEKNTTAHAPSAPAQVCTQLHGK